MPPNPGIPSPSARRTAPRAARAATCWLALCAAASAPAQDTAESEALDPVVVTGTRSEHRRDAAPVRTEVVGRQELERTSAQTVPEALANVPGVQMREIHGRSGQELWMQGLGPEQSLILLDGLPVTATSGSSVDITRIGLTDVERIEVVKGASSVLYGSSAMGGVVNILRRPIRPGLGLVFDADTGSRGRQNPGGRRLDAATSRAQAGIHGGTARLRGALRTSWQDDRGFAVPPQGWARQGDATRRLMLGARVEAELSDHVDAWLDHEHFGDDDRQRYDFSAPPRLVPQLRDERMRRERTTAGLNLVALHGWSASLRGLNERVRVEATDASQGVPLSRRDTVITTKLAGAQINAPQVPIGSTTHRVQFGGVVRDDQLRQSVDGASELDAASASRTGQELYVQTESVLTPRWLVSVGARAQRDPGFGVHAVPKLSARWLDMDDERTITVRSSIGRGYRVPNLKELHYRFDHSALGYVVDGNPDLRPESSTSLQAGVLYDRHGAWRAELNAFDNRIRDFIQVDQSAGRAPSPGSITTYRYGNVARGYTRGVETAVQWNVTPAWRLQAGWVWMRTRDLATQAPLNNRPAHSATAAVDWAATSHTRLAVRSRCQGSEQVASGTATQAARRSPGWCLVDTFLNHDLGRHATAFLTVQNLLGTQRDFQNPDDFGPVAGRTVRVGIRVRM